MHTRTRAEALQIETEKGEPPSPPADYYTLLHTLVAFTGIVWMLLGEKADLYQKLLGLVDILWLGSIEPDIPKFDGVLSRQIFWMVIVDVKRYCSGALTVQMLRRNGLTSWTRERHKSCPKMRSHNHNASARERTNDRWWLQSRKWSGLRSWFGGNRMQQAPPNSHGTWRQT